MSAFKSYTVSALSLLIVIAFITPQAVQAGTLFVDPAGNGMYCTAAEPCSSIQQAIDLSRSGDRILLGAGIYQENITIPIDKEALTLLGASRQHTILESDNGDVVPKFAPAGVPADIIIDIFAPGVTVANLSVRHPATVPTKRDIGIFVRPPAINATLRNTRIERLRIGDLLEPTTPGSRGILVFRATGTSVQHNELSGNFEDHIHLPTSSTEVLNNSVTGATRLGIVVIQESPDSLSVQNSIEANTVTLSGGDGIQIQGDDNLVQANRVFENGGFGVHLCGPASTPPCVAPGANATASGNVVKANMVEDNALGDVTDNGEGNVVR